MSITYYSYDLVLLSNSQTSDSVGSHDLDGVVDGGISIYLPIDVLVTGLVQGARGVLIERVRFLRAKSGKRYIGKGHLLLVRYE